MDERRLTKEISEADVGGNAGRGRPRRTFLDQIEEVLEKGQVRSTRNRRVCMRNLMTVEEAKSVCKDRSKWKEVISAYPKGKPAVMLCMYVCNVTLLTLESTLSRWSWSWLQL
jgi:hypothetical protein